MSRVYDHELIEIDQLTPILFCSGAVTDADIDAATVAGAQGYIAKPFDVDNLIETLRNTIKAHIRITNS